MDAWNRTGGPYSPGDLLRKIPDGVPFDATAVDGEDLTPDGFTVARLKDERDQALQRVQELEAELNIPWRPQPGHRQADVTQAAYEQLIATEAYYRWRCESLMEETARLAGYLRRIGLQLDKARYGDRDAIYNLLGDEQLQPYLWPDDPQPAGDWQAVIEANERGGVDGVIAALEAGND